MESLFIYLSLQQPLHIPCNSSFSSYVQGMCHVCVSECVRWKCGLTRDLIDVCVIFHLRAERAGDQPLRENIEQGRLGGRGLTHCTSTTGLGTTRLLFARRQRRRRRLVCSAVPVALLLLLRLRALRGQRGRRRQLGQVPEQRHGQQPSLVEGNAGGTTRLFGPGTAALAATATTTTQRRGTTTARCGRSRRRRGRRCTTTTGGGEGRRH